MASPEYPVTVLPDIFNKTEECFELGCTSFCPEWCLPFPPPPPPLPIWEHESEHSFSPLVIAIIGILASTFLLVSYYTVVAKYCTSWESLRRRLQRSERDSYDDDDDNQSAPNYSWPLISTGLEESVIKSIPIIKYEKDSGLVECADCSVCLSEFQEDESLRLLPKCNHAFHVPCIDTWLQSHSNCPLCRANIVSPPAETRIAIPQEGTHSISQSPNDSQDPNLREESEPHSSTPNSSNPNPFVNSSIAESDPSGRMDKEEAEGIEQEDSMFKVLMPSRIRAMSDLASKHRVDDIVELELQPMRRSVSLGSSNRFCLTISDLLAMQQGFEHGDPSVFEQSVAAPESSHRKNLGNELMVLRGVGKGCGKHLHQYQNKSKALSDASKSGILHNLKGPFTMKRSFSGGKFFLSKYNRSKNAILPL